MAPNKPRAKAQTVTPSSSPISMGTKTTGKSGIQIPLSWDTGRNSDCNRELEQFPSGKDIMEVIKVSSKALTTKIDALAADVSIMRHKFVKIQQSISEMEVCISKVEDKLKTDNREWHIFKKTNHCSKG